MLGGAGGTIGTLTAAEWNNGSLTALSIGTLKMTGLPLPNRSAGFIAGISRTFPMTFFRNSGTAWLPGPSAWPVAHHQQLYPR